MRGLGDFGADKLDVQVQRKTTPNPAHDLTTVLETLTLVGQKQGKGD